MVIVLLGLVVLVWVFSPTERQRRAEMDDLAVGADSTEVLRLLGAAPTRCAPTLPPTLRSGLPEDLPPATVENVLGRMQEETRERWLYPISFRRSLACGAREAHTELGIGDDGRVLWYVAITGKTPLELPEHYIPVGDTP